MGAYKRLYLEDSNDLIRLLFEETAKDKRYDFSYFLKGFIDSKYRRMLDKGNSRIINMSYDELISYLKRDYSNIYRRGKFNIDPLQAGWIGKMYNNLQFELKKPSTEIYEKLPIEKMMKYFKPLHTIDESVALEKIIKSNFKA